MVADDLFSSSADDLAPERLPLARRLRPATIEDYAGQTHLVGPRGPIREMLATGEVGSMLLYGPPGTGKTALAHLLASAAKARVRVLNATTATVDDLREVFAEARLLRASGRRTLLFLDEVHRFDKRQQSGLLPELEDGTILFVGATTENPSAYLLPALGSRVSIFELFPLDDSAVSRILDRAQVRMTDEARAVILARSDGDARRALGLLEAASRGRTTEQVVDLARIEEVSGRKALRGDRAGDSHYDIASAFIKSMRGSDPDAAIYWLARWIETGEDPRFIARRMTILASEDVGNADPRALFLATAAFQAVERVGMPESRIILAQVAAYLASAPKSNAAVVAIDEAQRDVRTGKMIEVPMHLRGTGYRDAERLGRGKGYVYPHDASGGFVRADYLGEKRSYYRPTAHGEEKRILDRLAAWWGKWPRS